MAEMSRTKLTRYRADPETMTKDPHYPLYQLGRARGFQEAMIAALDLLQEDFMTGDNRPSRGTPEYDAILAVTRRLAKRLREVKPSYL